MQRLPSRGKSGRPHPLQTAKSFSVSDTSDSPIASRNRSSTLPSSTLQIDPLGFASENLEESKADIFEVQSEDGTDVETEADSSGTFPESFEELPIEIKSLMERFLESLSGRNHTSPLSIDRIAELYQDFYLHAESYLTTHTNALISRIHSSRSPSASGTSLSSLSRSGGRKVSKTGGDNEPTQQMLTTNEIANRRKARRRLELRKIALEEAVERGVCEKMYRRLYRHGSTDDEERDEKLRSRAAALGLIGVGLRELLSSTVTETGTDTKDALDPSNEGEDGPRSLLADARSSLRAMDEEKYPLGKLKHLTATHQKIVEVLSKLFPSTSSADEVLPTLIYTIITTPPEEIHVVSNFAFIQRFRGSGKVDGEAAYCLTNLEAAIGFLETVDLSSIRPNEHPAGPAKSSSHPSTPGTEISDPLYRGLPPPESKDTPYSSPQIPQTGRVRSLSNILKPKPVSYESAGDSFLNSADNAVEAINNALDSSFNFLFGRLREKQGAGPEGTPEMSVPKTLEDARKLVNSPRITDEDASIGDADSTQEPSDISKDDSKLMDLFAGRRPARDRSVDSTRSASSAKKVAFAESASAAPATLAKVRGDSPKPNNTAATAVQQPSSGFAAVESMKTLGNSLNPLKGFGMRFGRSTSGTTTPTLGSMGATAPVVKAEETIPEKPAGFDLSGVAPPIRRFVDTKDARELNFFDVELLLRDYQRLVGVLKAAAVAAVAEK